MALVALKCPYCGGKLDAEGDHYICPFCNNKVVYAPDVINTSVSTHERRKSHGKPIIMSVKIKKIVKKIDFDGDAILLFEFRKRTTMGDSMPMSLIVLRNDCRITLFEEFDNVGKGQVIVSYNGGKYTVMIEGKVAVKINDVICQGYGEIPSGGTMVIGGAEFSFTSSNIEHL